MSSDATSTKVFARARSMSLSESYTEAPSEHKMEDLFANNVKWSAKVKAKHPEFFEKLSQSQSPDFLWIGCSDSRVEANSIVGLIPGELFVHRNVANVVAHTDFNCLAVMQFAIDCLQVKHVIVCGHYGCGGVLATLHGKRVGLVDNWLRHVGDVKSKHQRCLNCIPDMTDRGNRLCELNAVEQAFNVCCTTVVRDAWARGQALTVHAVIHGMRDGLLVDLQINASSMDEAEAQYDEIFRKQSAAKQQEC